MKKIIPPVVLALTLTASAAAWADQLVNCVTNNDRYSVQYGQTCCLRLPQSITECHGGNIRPSGPPNCTGPGACAVR
jgi:hypothetical protein